MDINLIERIWSKTTVNQKTKCWLWNGRLFNNGYGSYSEKSAKKILFKE